MEMKMQQPAGMDRDASSMAHQPFSCFSMENGELPVKLVTRAGRPLILNQDA